MRERFDSEYIRSELERIGDQLEVPLTVYLIGGGAMAFRDLKDTTKDIDLVVTDGDALRQLQAVLLESGYDVVGEPGEEYDDLGAQCILENDDGCRIDVFNQQVVNKLVLSEGMRQRSVTHLVVTDSNTTIGIRDNLFVDQSFDPVVDPTSTTYRFCSLFG